MLKKLLIKFVPKCLFISFIFDNMTTRFNNTIANVTVITIAVLSLMILSSGIYYKKSSLTLVLFFNSINLYIYSLEFFQKPFNSNKFCEKYLNKEFYEIIFDFLKNYMIYILFISLVISLILACAFYMIAILGKILISLYITSRILEIDIANFNFSHIKDIFLLLIAFGLFLGFFVVLKITLRIILAFFFSIYGSFYVLGSLKMCTESEMFNLDSGFMFNEDGLEVDFKSKAVWVTIILAVFGFTLQFLKTVKYNRK